MSFASPKLSKLSKAVDMLNPDSLRRVPEQKKLIENRSDERLRSHPNHGSQS